MIRSPRVLAALGTAVVVGVLATLLGPTRVGVAIAVVAALAAAIISLVGLRAVQRVGRDVRRIERRQVRQHQRLRTTLTKQLGKLRAQRRRQAAAQSAVQVQLQHVVATRGEETKARLQSIETSIGELRRHLMPERFAPVLTGGDMTTAGDRVLSDLAFDGTGPSVVLTLQTFSPGQVFAGIRTAILAATSLSAELGLPLRVLVVDPTRATLDETRESLAAVIAESPTPHLSASVRVSIDGARDRAGHHRDDVWVATFWTTAWAISGLVRRGQARAERVVYLIQDWEPSFYPWGDLNAKATSTYEAGFEVVINSMSLARYAAAQTGRPVDERRVFAPELDLPALERAAAEWKPSPGGDVRVLFYARPSKPRNMFTTGLQALQSWAESLPADQRLVVRMAGEPVGPIDLGERIQIERLGKVSYEEYYALLSDTDVGLALMSSPHPGHLALELPLTGIPTVTNTFGSYREQWVRGLLVTDPHPVALGRALAEAALLNSSRAIHQPGAFVRPLGGTLTSAIADVARCLRTAG